MTTLNVDLGPGRYPIMIEAGSLEMLPQLIRDNTACGQVALIADETVAELYGQRVKTILKVAGLTSSLFKFPEGEASKNLQMFSDILTWLITGGFKRSDLILALGGGVTGDLAGFAAASYLRGIPFAQIPTTILAQVDSSVGGKTGINHGLGKNLIGAFHQPEFVLIDPTLLRTLDKRERWAGLGEVLKYGIIADEDFLNLLEGRLDDLVELTDVSLLEDTITRCCSIKAEIVKQDEQEKGLRRILNFGHTLGHALEAETGYGIFRHGEAVVYGMHWASWISSQKGYLKYADYKFIKNILERFPLPPLPENMTAAKLVYHMTRDKKQTQSGLNWVLLEGIGKTRVEPAHNVSEFTEGWLQDVQKESR